MRLLRRIGGGLRALFSRGRRERELDEELRAFLDASIEDKMRAGASREAATRAARLQLGSAAEVKDHVRDVAWETRLELLWQDVRHAARTLRRTPIVSAVAIVLLAVAIGVNSAIFTLVDVVMLRPLPVRAPGELVEPLTRYPGDPRRNGFTWEFYEQLRDRSTAFSDVIGFVPARVQVAVGSGAAETLDAAYAVGTMFDALGLRPAIGRLIGPDDAKPGAAPVVVLSWSYWRRHFSLNPAILGTQIELNGVSSTIVGVTPEAFIGLQRGVIPAVWLPVARPPRLGLLARLKPGVTFEQAKAELRALPQLRLELSQLARNDPRWLRTEIELASAATGLSGLRDRFSAPLRILMAAVGLLLLLACTNVASMLLARAEARRHEMAVRVSLGAGRWRLARQVLIESALLAAIGTAIGAALAMPGARTLVRSLMAGRLPPGWPAQLDLPLGPDPRILLFTAAAGAITALVFGLAPAWRAFTAPPVSPLRDAAASTPRTRRGTGSALVAAQIALSIVLLSAALLLAGHLSRLRNDDLGFQRQGVLLVSLDPQGSGLDRAQLAHAYRVLLDRLHAVPGVSAATLSAVTPIHGSAASRFVNVEGQTEAPEHRSRVSLNWIAPRYFATFGTPLLAGREFGFEDAGRPGVAIVNQALVRHYFSDANPIGKRLIMERESEPFEIVGVVADAKYSDLHEPAPRTVYLNAFQGRIASHFALRTSLPPASLAGPVRAAVAQAVPGIKIANITTLADQVDSSIVIERLMATLSMVFAVAGAVLAAVGLYGLLAYTVTRRTREIGLRLALGATRVDVLRLIVGSALGLACAGLLAGLPLAWWTARVGARLIPNLATGWIGSTVLAGAALLLVVLLAAYLPARRAARVEPAEALRQA